MKIQDVRELVAEFEPVFGLLEELTIPQHPLAQFPNPCYVCIAVMSAWHNLREERLILVHSFSPPWRERFSLWQQQCLWRLFTLEWTRRRKGRGQYQGLNSNLPKLPTAWPTSTGQPYALKFLSFPKLFTNWEMGIQSTYLWETFQVQGTPWGWCNPL